MKFLKQYAYSMWLGFSLGLANIHYYDINFWIVLIPTISLVVWSQSTKE